MEVSKISSLFSLPYFFILIRCCYFLGTDIGRVTPELGTNKGDNNNEVSSEEAWYLQNKGRADVLRIKHSSVMLAYVYSSSIHTNYLAHGLSTISS